MFKKVKIQRIRYLTLITVFVKSLFNNDIVYHNLYILFDFHIEISLFIGFKRQQQPTQTQTNKQSETQSIFQTTNLFSETNTITKNEQKYFKPRQLQKKEEVKQIQQPVDTSSNYVWHWKQQKSPFDSLKLTSQKIEFTMKQKPEPKIEEIIDKPEIQLQESLEQKQQDQQKEESSISSYSSEEQQTENKVVQTEPLTVSIDQLEEMDKQQKDQTKEKPKKVNKIQQLKTYILNESQNSVDKQNQNIDELKEVIELLEEQQQNINFLKKKIRRLKYKLQNIKSIQ